MWIPLRNIDTSYAGEALFSIIGLPSIPVVIGTSNLKHRLSLLFRLTLWCRLSAFQLTYAHLVPWGNSADALRPCEMLDHHSSIAAKPAEGQTQSSGFTWQLGRLQRLRHSIPELRYDVPILLVTMIGQISLHLTDTNVQATSRSITFKTLFAASYAAYGKGLVSKERINF